MEFSYAISRAAAGGSTLILGKGNDADAAREAGLRAISDLDPDAAALRANLLVVSRADAEEQGVAPPGAPLIGHAHLRRYVVEDHAAPMSGPNPTGVVSR